jgi:hypothetical protein
VNIFEQYFGVNPNIFNSVEEIDEFIEKKTGRKLDIGYKHEDIAPARGNIFPLKDLNPDKIIDAAIKKYGTKY